MFSERAPGREALMASAALTSTPSGPTGATSLWCEATALTTASDFAHTLDEVRAHDGVRAFDLVADGLADVVQEARPFGRLPHRGPVPRPSCRRGGPLRPNGPGCSASNCGGNAGGPAVLTISTCMGGSPQLWTASSPKRMIVSSISWFTLATISSMRVGWIRPSRISRVMASRAISRRTGSNAGKHHGIGRVVNQHRHAGGGLEGADVAAFAADDAALDVVALEGDGGGGGFEGVLAGVTLDGDADDAAGLFLRARLGLFDDVARQVARVARGFLLDFLEELRAGFVLGQMRTSPGVVRAVAG